MKKQQQTLSRREREIMDIFYRDGALTASDVVERLPGKPSNSTVRTLLRILESKGHIKHEQKGMHYVYSPTVHRDRARRSALKHLVTTFFDDSPETVVSTLLDEKTLHVSDEQLDSMAEMIEKARKEGK